jgi:hypothetical protein
VKVTVSPGQFVDALAEMDTEAGRLGLIVTVLVAVAFAHPPVPVTV